MDVVEVVDMVAKVADRQLVISLKLTVDVDVVVAVVKVVESTHEIVRHQLLHGKIWKIMRHLKIQTLCNLSLSVQVWNVVPCKPSHP